MAQHQKPMLMAAHKVVWLKVVVVHLKINHATRLRVSAGANIATMSHATTTHTAAVSILFILADNAAATAQSIMKCKSADMFLSTTAKHTANTAQNTTLCKIAICAKSMFANQNAAMFANTTISTFAEIQTAQLLAQMGAKAVANATIQTGDLIITCLSFF